MRVFTEAEIEYLRGQMHGHLATVGRDSQPHVVPVTFWLNLDQDTIDIGGINFGATKKWRDAQHNPRVTFLVDDSPEPGRARAVEVRGTAELFTTGGDRINPRFPNFADECFRIRPTRIVSWGMEGGTTGWRAGPPRQRAVGGMSMELEANGSGVALFPRKAEDPPPAPDPLRHVAFRTSRW